jgi:hypothetical protein
MMIWAAERKPHINYPGASIGGFLKKPGRISPAKAV